jgi:hypothetical protein
MQGGWGDHRSSVCGGHIWIALHLHGRLFNQPPNILVDIVQRQATRVSHPDVLAE